MAALLLVDPALHLCGDYPWLLYTLGHEKPTLDPTSDGLPVWQGGPGPTVSDVSTVIFR